MLAGDQDHRGGAGTVQVHGEAGAGGAVSGGAGGKGGEMEGEWEFVVEFVPNPI